MTRSTTIKTRTDSTDRTPVLSAISPVRHTKSAVSRFGVAARRLLNTLMRSLASPHV